jgi:hypothetical protein
MKTMRWAEYLAHTAYIDIDAKVWLESFEERDNFFHLCIWLNGRILLKWEKRLLKKKADLVS